MAHILASRIENWADSYVADGSLPCVATAVSVNNEVIYEGRSGWKDEQSGTKLTGNETFAMASCTKVVTAVAAMQLYEQGLWSLDDPISKFIPSFAQMPGVIKPKNGAYINDGEHEIEPLSRPVTMRDVLTHTSGVTYSFMTVLSSGAINLAAPLHNTHKVDAAKSLEEMVDILATIPLVHQPGASWNYSMGIDIVGRVVEVISGQTLDVYFDEHIFQPLGMTSTAFAQRLTDDMKQRAVTGFVWGGKRGAKFPMPAENMLTAGEALNPGGGLYSTLEDFLLFAQMLANRGMGKNGRVLGSRTVEFMSQNHLPEGCARGPQMILVSGKKSDDPGYGFGLGVAVAVDPTKGQTMAPVGSFEWGGATSTVFWADMTNKVAVVSLTQLLPSIAYPLRAELKQIVYGWLPEETAGREKSRL
jgi:CubicO group peptidase (beta-lactamase class C family)